MNILRVTIFLVKINLFFKQLSQVTMCYYSLTYNMAANFDCGKFKLYVFIDLSKGFDTVNFTEKKWNIMTLMKEHWPDPKVIYTKKQQYIAINGDIKNLFEKNCGVPQGSIFRPFLIWLYLNDFHLYI